MKDLSLSIHRLQYRERVQADEEVHVVHCRKASGEVTHPLTDSQEDLSTDLNKEVF